MKRSKNKVSLFVFAVLLCAGIFYYRLTISGTIDVISSYVAYPFICLQHAVIHPMKRWFEKRRAVHDLEALVRMSQAQTHQLLSELVACKSLACFSDETGELKEFNARYSEKNVLVAQVLMRNFSDDSHFFLIDRGTQAGVEVDMVVVYKNCLVGRIIAVYPWYSKVLLLSDRLCKVPAISVTHKARGIYMGNMETGGSFNYVSHLEKMEQGELLISSGEGLVFPKGFGIGTIRSFDVNNTDYTYTTNIDPLIDLRTIEYCSVVKKGTEYRDSIVTQTTE